MDFTKDQQWSIDENSRKILVTASAGAGKTTTMIARVMRLIEAGYDVDSMILITFTVNSAADMKDKLEEAIRERIVKETDRAKVARLRIQLDKLNFTEISTVDAFCKKLVSDNFKKLKINPRSTVLDTVQESILKRRAFQQVISRHLAGNDGARDDDFMLLYERYRGRYNDNSLYELVCMKESIYSFLCAQKDPEKYVQVTGAVNYNTEMLHGELVRDYYDHLKRYTIYLRRRIEDAVQGYDAPVYLKNVQGLLDVMDYIIGSSEIPRFETIPKSPTLSSNKKKDTIPDAVKATVSDLKATFKAKVLDEIKEFWELYERSMRCLPEERRVVTKYLEICAEFIETYRALKQEKDYIDFADMESLAYKLLSDPEVAADVREKYRFLFVDEYQDINGLQNAIIDAMGIENLYMVGDLKQSIYGFRQSDCRYIGEKRKEYIESPDACSIDFKENFRSHRDIIRFVNDLFGVVMTEDNGGCDYAHDGAMEARGNIRNDEDTPAVTVCFVTPSEEDEDTRQSMPEVYSVQWDETYRDDASKDDVREAQFVYDNIVDLIKNHQKHVYEDGEWKTESITYGDIALLYRSRSQKVKTIARYLSSKGIPLAMFDLTAKDATPEIEELISYFRVLDNPQNDYALVSLMLHPYGNFSEDHLANIRLSDDEAPFYDIVAKLAPGSVEDELYDKVDKFRKKLDNDRILSLNSNIHDMAQHYVESAHLRERALAADEDGTRYVVLNNFLENYCASDLTSIADFLERYDYDDPDNKYSAADSGVGDRVVLSTVHGSKGLQYNFVFLIGCGVGTKSESGDIQYDRFEGLGVKMKEDGSLKESIWTKLLKARINKRNYEEMRRTLYVALTRARMRLFVSGEGDITSEPKFIEKSYMDLITTAWYSIPDKSYIKTDFRTERREEPANVFGNYVIDEYSKEYRDLAEDVYPYDTGVPQKGSVTSIVHDLTTEDEDGDIVAIIRSRKEASDTAETDTETGIAYHRAMELIDFATPNMAGVADKLDELTASGEMTESQRKMVSAKLVYNCLNLPIIKEAIGHRQLREQPFYLRLEENDTQFHHNGMLVQGIIDLLYFTDEGAVLVDYKFSNRSEEALRHAYENQLRLYKSAIEEIFDVKVVRSALVLLNSARQIIFDI